MDDKTTALFLKALETLTAQVKRIADAVEAHQADAETLSFPLGEFKAFDWANVGMRVVQHDSDGPSVIQAPNGKMCKRRSNDKFGTEIWFSYCSGKADDNTPKYAKVIEFKEVKAPEPLGRKTEQALRQAQPPAPAPAKLSPAYVPSIDGAQGGAVPLAPTKPAAASQPTADPFAAWTAARKLTQIERLPEWLLLAEGDKRTDIEARTQALIEFAAAPQEAQAELLGLSDQHQELVGKCREMQLPLGHSLSVLPPSTRQIEVSATIATINNIIAAEQRKRKADHAPAVAASGQQPAANGARSYREFMEWWERACKANAGQVRAPNDATKSSVYVALKVACGGDDAKLHALIEHLCSVKSYKDVSNARLYTLQAWMKPGLQSKPMYPHAAAEVNTILSTLPQPAAEEPQPA
jgi:hypothetical protein